MDANGEHNHFWDILMNLSRELVPDTYRFIGYMSILLTDVRQYNRVGFFQVDVSGKYALPLLVIGPDTKEEHEEVVRKLRGVNLEDKLSSFNPEDIQSRTSLGLEARFKECVIPLDKPSRIKQSYQDGYSITGKMYKPELVTDIDKLVENVFGTDDYHLITVKGRGEKVLGWFYADFRFTGGDLSEVHKSQIRNIEVMTGRHMEEIRYREELVEKEKLANLGKNLAYVEHEIRKPILSMGGWLERLKKLFGNLKESSDLNKYMEKLEDCVNTIVAEHKRLFRFTNGLLDFSKGELHPKYNVLNAIDELNGAIIIADKYGIKYSINCGQDELKVWADPDYFRGAVVNMAENAFYAICADNKKGELKAGIKTEIDDGVRYGVITFNNPQYIPPTAMENIEALTPFFTTKGKDGVGLGLTMTQKYMGANGGKFSIQTNQLDGTTTTLKFLLYNNQDKKPT